MPDVHYITNPAIDNDALNELFRSAWHNHMDRDFREVLARNLACVAAFAGDQLVGFVNVAWDGGAHAFLLDPTVRREFQRQGIGSHLVRDAILAAREGRVEWLHVDCEPGHSEFYKRCGFLPTAAGVLKLAHR